MSGEEVIKIGVDLGPQSISRMMKLSGCWVSCKSFMEEETFRLIGNFLLAGK